jgi:hypothetical protein
MPIHLSDPRIEYVSNRILLQKTISNHNYHFIYNKIRNA